MKKRVWLSLISSAYVFLAALAAAAPVSAHDGPTQGNEWLMADWMLFSFLIFFGVGLVVFIVALKRGLLSNLEDAKYYILTIDEKDYYTPEWAKEEDDDPHHDLDGNHQLDQPGAAAGAQRE